MRAGGCPAAGRAAVSFRRGKSLGLGSQTFGPEMTRLAAQDGTMAEGTTSGDARGLSRYWPVLWRGAKDKRAEITIGTRGQAFCH